MNYYYIGNDGILLRELSVWVESGNNKLFDAQRIVPESGATIFFLGNAVREATEFVPALPSENTCYIFADRDIDPEIVAESGYGLIWAGVDIDYQISLLSEKAVGNLLFSAEADIRNLITLPIFSRCSYDSFLEFLVLMNRALDASKTTLVVLFPVGKFGVILASSDNSYFRNYVLHIDSYPELREAINFRKSLCFTSDELKSRGATLSEESGSSFRSAIPLQNRYGDVVAALLVRSDGEPPLSEGGKLAQTIFSVLFSKFFLFEKGSANVGGCPFLTNLHPEEGCWAVLEQLPGGIVISDRSGKILFLNGALEDILKIERKAILHKNLQSIFEIELGKVHQERPYYHFYTLSRKDLVWKRFQIAEEKWGFVVEEKKKSSAGRYERDLKRLRVALDTVPPFLAFDIMGAIRFMNREARALLKVVSSSEDELSILSFTEKDDAMKQLFSFLKRDKGHSGTVRIPIDVGVVDAYGEKPKGYRALFSYSREAELYFLKFVPECENCIESGSENRAVGEGGSQLFQKLAGTISHNFNQNFSVMQMYLDILKEKVVADSDLSEYIERLGVELDKAVSLTKKVAKLRAEDSEYYVGKTEILKMDGEGDDERH